MNTPPTLVVTTGEPAGIGPDICAMLAAGGDPPTANRPVHLIFLADPDILRARVRELGLQVAVETLTGPDDASPHERGVMQVLPVAAARPVTPGRLDAENARYVLDLLDLGVDLCRQIDTGTQSGRSAQSDRGAQSGSWTQSGRSALVTAPVQKSIINEAGIAFTGHTEWLAERTGAACPVMMLASPNLRVALATTHLPLSGVAGAITAERLERVIAVLHGDLRARFGIEAPRIMVLGLNPHAGEHGVLGMEEMEIVEPLLRTLADRGLAVTGPVPADTAFTPHRLRSCDAVLAMYHDQGLPVIKALDFGEAVNVTLGLPIVRTSVDHGTALDLAGTGDANPDSLVQAAELALELLTTSPP